MRPPRSVGRGEFLPPRTIGPITQTDIVRFAGAGGDFNPLHHDPATAERAGFGSVISMGQMQAGMMAAFISDFFGVENLRNFSVKFTAPVRLGDTLELRGEVVEIQPSGSGPQANLAARITVGQTTVVTGTAVVAVAETDQTA